MNATVETIGPCKHLLRVEVDAETVKQTFEAATREYARRAKLPGFRPGKAPRQLIERQFAQGIQEEARNRLINDSFNKALDQHKLRPVVRPEVEEGDLRPGEAFKYSVTLESEPDFTVPEYKGIAVRLEEKQVTDADIEKALDILREQKAGYENVERPVSTGDFVVVRYTGTCEGKPITEFNPTAKGLTQQESYWLEVRTDHFIPGFTDQLLGAGRGEHRTVKVTFPPDFVLKEVAGKEGVYEVDILEVKEKRLPALDDELARSYQAPDLATLREGVVRDLERELADQRKRKTRDQIVASLLSRVNFDLPETLVQHETRSEVYEIVKANAERGIPKEAMEQHQDQIYQVATNSAQERLKVRYLLRRIGEAENLAVTREELTQRVLQLAAAYRIKPDRFVKQLQERNALGEVRLQILTGKVLEWLEEQADVQTVPPAPTGTPTA